MFSSENYPNYVINSKLKSCTLFRKLTLQNFSGEAIPNFIDYDTDY